MKYLASTFTLLVPGLSCVTLSLSYNLSPVCDSLLFYGYSLPVPAPLTTCHLELFVVWVNGSGIATTSRANICLRVFCDCMTTCCRI